jgi:hypothetical protein
MLINLSAWINSQSIRIKAAPMDMLINIPNLAAINTASRKIAALGKTEDEMKAQSPVGWRLHGKRLSFVTPFDVSAFDPKLARSVLMVYANRATTLAHPGVFGQMLGYLVDRFTFDIQLARYEEVPADLRQAFERLLKTDRTVNRASINGRQVKGE